MLSNVGKSLRHRLSLPLPGEEAQFKMAHAERRQKGSLFRVPENPKRSAVLIMLYEHEQTLRFPLIVRPIYDGVHSGQAALPGGKYEEIDQTLEATAIREAGEETGIFKDNIDVVGQLSNLYIPPSNFLVTPFVAIHKQEPVFIPHTREVERIVEVDVEKIMDERFIREKKIKLSNGVEITTPCYDFDGLIVWGATAMILSEFKSVMYETGY